MQLSLVGTHGSRTVRAGFPGFACSARAVLMVIAMSASPQRRRSMPISTAISAASASPVAAPSGRSASTGRHWTGSEKLLRYWIQSQTTRRVDRSTAVDVRASKSGPSAAGTFSGPPPRSFATGRMSMRTTTPRARCVCAPGASVPPRGDRPRGGWFRAGRPRGGWPRGGWPRGGWFRRIPAPDSRVIEDLRDSLLEARCHDVDSADSRDLEYLPGDLRADPQSLVGDPTGRHAAQSARDFVGDMHTGHDGAHMLQGPQRADRPHAGQNSAAPVQPQVADLGHPPRESGDIEDELRLHELRARGHFLAEAGGAETGRRGGWVLHGANEPSRRRVQLPAGQQPAFITHRPSRPHKLNAVL